MVKKYDYEKNNDRSQWVRRQRKLAQQRFGCFLFLIAGDKCAATLDGAVPVLAHWRLSALLGYLQPEEVERLISSCNPNSSVGIRDRAIFLLLARLRFRAGDIVQLCLDDIDWKEATIQVSGKSRHQVRLPLTQEVGNAIVAYLLYGRPRTLKEHRCKTSQPSFDTILSKQLRYTPKWM